MQFAAAWPLSRNHFLNIPQLALLPPIEPPKPSPRASDAGTTIAAWDGEWRSVREIADKVQAKNDAVV